MSSGHSDCCQLNCLQLHSWFKVHMSLRRQLFPCALALAFKWQDFSMKIKIVSDAWGRRKVRRRETLILTCTPSLHSARQAESSRWERDWLLWGLGPAHRGLGRGSHGTTSSKRYLYFSNALQEYARTWTALLNSSDRGEDKSQLTEVKQQAATCSDSVYLWQSVWGRVEASPYSAGERMQTGLL